MTIELDNWCPTCEDACHDHATICTVCGSPLQPPPPRSPTTPTSTPSANVRPFPPELHNQLNQANDDLTSMLSTLRAQMQSIRGANVGGPAALPINNDEWQAVPLEAMDPQASGPKSRPTAKATLEALPRITLESKSSLLHQAMLELSSSCRNDSSQKTSTRFVALLGEFGPAPPHLFRNASLVVSKPRTGKGGLSEETKSELRPADRSRTILYIERGDGLTFVQKAIMAQEAGASAVVIGNNNSSSWPYVMKDSKGEAASCGLTIPVVMVKQSDGMELVKLCKKQQSSIMQCLLEIQENPNDCVVCRDSFEISQKVLRLPSCGHVFHEACGLAWLNHHNTCPYCRRELPTDDAEYEQERRRIQRTHAGSQVSTNENWQDFYG